MAEPMPFDLWWSPSLRRFLSRHENDADEHLVWVFHGSHESLRRYLGTGLDGNPPMPDDAVQLVPSDRVMSLTAYRELATGYKGQMARADALQARITDAVAKINAYDGYGAGMMFHDELLVALQGDDPSAPATDSLSWRTEDGGIAAVMCSDCHTLGGHDNDCPRRPPDKPVVPCGNPNPDCGRLGGRARCGSCSEDEPRAPFTTADQAFPEEPR